MRRMLKPLGLLFVLTILACSANANAGSEPRPLLDPRYPVIMDNWPVRIDAEHQFFIDDELIASKQGVERVVLEARKHPDNPVLRPHLPWADDMVLLYGSVVRDPETGRFMMWYLGRNFEDRNPLRTMVCYATSGDGVKWEEPELGLIDYQGSKANNIVLLNHGGGLDTLIVFIDPNERDPQRRFKMLVYQFHADGWPEGLFLYTSGDGVHWQERSTPVMIGAPAWPKNADNQFRGDVMLDGIGDVTYVRWDARLGRYVANLKAMINGMRSRMLSESDDLIHWSRPRVILRPDESEGGTQLYGMVDFPYESLWLGIVQRYRATTDLTLDLTWAVSHDGRHWSRVEPKTPFILVGPDGTWDDGNQSPANNPPIRVGDELYFYYGGRDESHNTRPGIGAIGLATLPVDRFAQLRAEEKGTIVTRPLTFDRGRLHVNADAAGGEIRVGLLDRDSKPIPGFGPDDCTPVSTDTSDATVSWSGGNVIEALDDPVRLCFELRKAGVYAFWVDPE